MPRINIKESESARYAQVKAEQAALYQQYGMQMKIARMCPYCQHRVEMLLRGQHGAALIKCSHCGEDILFPPISFRTV